MDKVDIQILEILQEDARASASDISKKVKLSIPSVGDRIRKLNDKIITKYAAILNHKEANLDPWQTTMAVSYTHLSCRRSTLCRSRWSPYH